MKKNLVSFVSTQDADEARLLQRRAVRLAREAKKAAAKEREPRLGGRPHGGRRGAYRPQLDEE